MVTEYLLPDSADEAAAQLASGAAVMAGGTTVMPAVLAGSLRADARRRPRARGTRRASTAAGGRTVLGACVTLAAVAG